MIKWAKSQRGTLGIPSPSLFSLYSFFLHFLHSGSVLEEILEGSGFQCNGTKIYGSGRKCNLQQCQDFKTLKLLKMQSSLSDWAKEIFAHCWTVTGCGR